MFEDNGVVTIEAPSDVPTPEASPVASAPTGLRLSAREKLFEATGTVALRCGSRTVTLPIRAVSTEEGERLCRPFRPIPTRRPQLVNGKRQLVHDTEGFDHGAGHSPSASVRRKNISQLKYQ